MKPAHVSALFLVAAVFLTQPAAGQKSNDQRLRKESQSAYSAWVTNDVGYIITQEERDAFAQLRNDEEREQFIEQFWLRRDPTPDTLENEFKEEHYRRIAYANEHFASGLPGWNTDRGHIYIAFGPPDAIESHPSGGSYTRPLSEGGGITSTFPFEQWRYRHLNDVGDDIVLEFVDSTMSGEYRLTTNPSEKDALLHVPGLRAAGTRPTDTQGRNQFDRIELESKIFRAPKSQFSDLQTSLVTSGIRYNMLPMTVRVYFVPVTEASSLTYIAIQFDNKDLQFQAVNGVQRANVLIVGRISTMNHRVAGMFEDSVVVESPAQMLGAFAQRKSVYGKSVPLAPGAYRLDVIAKDSAGTVSNYQVAVIVPRLEPEKLQSSSIILSDVIELVSSKGIGTGQFVIGDSRVRPRVDGVFRRDEKMGVYLKLYNASAHSSLQYELLRTSTNESVMNVVEDIAASAQVTLNKFFDMRDLSPGHYTVRVKVTGADGQTLAPSAAFSVL